MNRGFTGILLACAAIACISDPGWHYRAAGAPPDDHDRWEHAVVVGEGRVVYRVAVSWFSLGATAHTLVRNETGQSLRIDLRDASFVTRSGVKVPLRGVRLSGVESGVDPATPSPPVIEVSPGGAASTYRSFGPVDMYGPAARRNSADLSTVQYEERAYSGGHPVIAAFTFERAAD